MAQTPPPVEPDAGAEDGDEIRIAPRGVRKATAAAMVRSAFSAPHVTEFLTVDVTRTIRLLDRLATQGVRANVLAAVARACLIAMPRHPTLNSRWDDESGEIVRYRRVRLGIAVATERGILVPSIDDAAQLDLAEIAATIRQLAADARAGTASSGSLTGGTFTITNFGVFGVDAGTPIINPGEAAILGMGAVRRMPWEHRGRIALRDVLTLSLSFDHRVIDGEQGARFLAEIGMLLSDPASAFAAAPARPRPPAAGAPAGSADRA